MKKYCKHVDITDTAFIWEAVSNCLRSKDNHPGLVRYLASELKIPNGELWGIIKYGTEKEKRELFDPIVKKLSRNIKNRTYDLHDIRKAVVIDNMSGKEREIGIQHMESCLYDHIAVLGLKDLFRTIGKWQVASIPDRGQVFGASKIEEWLKDRRLVYYVKMDVVKCYKSVSIPKLVGMIRKRVANRDLVFLTAALLSKHKNGLSIGSYLSQWLCNYYLSHAYHFAEEKLFRIRNKKDGTKQRCRLVVHVLFYMDDILLLGKNKRHMRKGAEQLQEFMRDQLDLLVKPWEVKDLRKRQHGRLGFIDMMGFRCHKGRKSIRRRIWKKIRRVILHASKQLVQRGKIALATARSFSSYYGYIKNSNSKFLLSAYGVCKIKAEAGRVISEYDKRQALEKAA